MIERAACAAQVKAWQGRMEQALAERLERLDSPRVQLAGALARCRVVRSPEQVVLDLEGKAQRHRERGQRLMQVRVGLRGARRRHQHARPDQRSGAACVRGIPVGNGQLLPLRGNIDGLPAGETACTDRLGEQPDQPQPHRGRRRQCRIARQQLERQ